MTHHPDKAREAAADDRVTFAKDIFEIVEGRCNKPGTIRELILARLDAFLTAQKAAHAKMLRNRAAEWDTWGTSRIDHKTIATEYRRLADKIEGGE